MRAIRTGASGGETKDKCSGEAPRPRLKTQRAPDVKVVKNHLRMHRTHRRREMASNRSGRGVSASDVR